MAIAKSYQFTNIFKDELRNVIYSNEHLENRKDIEDIWRRVTESLCKQKYSTINKKLFETVKKYYLPIESEYYNKRFDLVVNIETIPENPGFLKITEEIEADITSEEADTFDYTYSAFIPRSSSDDITDYNLKEFSMNDAKLDFERDNLLSKVVSEESVSVKFSYKCERKLNDYRVKRTEEKIICLSHNPYRIHRATWMFKSFKVTINYPKSLDIRFIDLGVLGKWNVTKDEINGLNRIRANYNALMFKNQGFMVTLKEV
ncbi:hypothetical protein [uncultured Algibacter sp.]|uniref:hypothetical protein n=1 Tax=uncultured Algibacter sp. TaxID=298659 RepID=UPI0026104E92|nr:hypothetical protein [uncultured Algibacter sp.]